MVKTKNQWVLLRGPFAFRHTNLVDYMGHCEWAFKKFGVDATSWLCTREHWDEWLQRFTIYTQNVRKAVWECNRFVGKFVYSLQGNFSG